MDRDFEGQVALVVGGAQGIGRATAAMFARRGASVVLGDLRPTVKDTLAEIEAETGMSDGLAVTVDVTDLQSCRQAAAATHDRYGRIDALAVIAGVLQEPATVVDLEIDEWDRVMAVNLKGTFLMTKAVVPYMMEQRRGRIVTIASWYGHSGHAFFSAYCTSKAGVIVLTQCLAAELSDYGVTVNTICPGNINTSMHQEALRGEAAERGISEEEMRRIEWDKIPLRKAGDPEDIADAVGFLASDQAKYITGASLDVNGGVLFR
jgi:NAD(P)-dependent dehydrogenase (short-subunit alcohol dehydrogenase family)